MTIARALWGISYIFGEIPNLFAHGRFVQKILNLVNVFSLQYGQPTKPKQVRILLKSTYINRVSTFPSGGGISEASILLGCLHFNFNTSSGVGVSTESEDVRIRTAPETLPVANLAVIWFLKLCNDFLGFGVSDW